jgi:class 3 adenylate cyclase
MVVQFVKARITNEVVVVAFDMCSSTDIMEELTLKGDVLRLQRFLILLKRYLADQQKEIAFDAYKFTGDGWILLFPVATEGPELLRFLVELCAFFKRTLKKEVLNYLDTPPKLIGLTFGIERGLLGAMSMFQRREYVGRAINIACRLQGALKDKGGSPAYKALVSNAVFNDYFAKNANGMRVFKVTRTLRNVRGGADFRCRKIELLEA